MKKQLPKLPHGQGTYSYVRDSDSIIFKKIVKFEDGSSKRVSVVGQTVRECNELMDQKLLKINKNIISSKQQSLKDAIYIWLDAIKRPRLKEQSFNRLEKTIKNQICTTEISKYSYDVITPEQIQSVINDLNEKHYSHSSIKKTYDVLNDFYRYVSARYKIDNPMALVEVPIASKIKAETKTIEFFEQEDIDLLIVEADARWDSGGLRYPYGNALVANIYMGMRIGELLAINWGDVDFDKNVIYVNKTVIEAANPEYDHNDPERMKELGIHKTRNIIQKSTKMSKNRYVPMNTKARELMKKQYVNSQFKSNEDLVICSRNKKIKTIKNIADTLIRMETDAGTTVRTGSTHVLRHTCASLYFRAGVPIETICQILGNTREVCEKTYIHFIEEQLQDAASKITAIEV